MLEKQRRAIARDLEPRPRARAVALGAVWVFFGGLGTWSSLVGEPMVAFLAFGNLALFSIIVLVFFAMLPRAARDGLAQIDKRLVEARRRREPS